MPYATPPPLFTRVIDAPPLPSVAIAPGGGHLALTRWRPHPPITVLARPYRPLAGLRVEAGIRARRRVRQTATLSLLRVSDGAEQVLDLPPDARAGPPVWAPDGRRLAFTVDRADGVGVWVADVATGQATELPGITVSDILTGEDGDVLSWSRDGQSLLALTVPAGAPAAAAPAPAPGLRETAGQHSRQATFQDLLRDETDEAAFDLLATTVPWRIDPVTGAGVALGPPGLYYGLTDSPDGQYLLALRLARPFSFRVPWHWFARRAEVRTASGEPVTVVADLPASEEVPRHGVPEGPRMVSWEERAPARLVWTQALDGGDPARPASHRDRIFGLTAPFTGPPSPVFDVAHRCAGWYDLDTARQLVLVEHDRDRRWRTSWLVDLADPGRNEVLFDRSVNDAYADPGSPLVTLNEDGTRTALGDGTSVFLRGEGAAPDGKRPFLDRYDLETRTASRLWRSPADRLERVLSLTAKASELIVWHESPAEPPNLRAVPLDGGPARELTAWPHPYPEATGITRRLVTHDRGDGVTLSGVLHLPPGYDQARDGRLPLVVWAYPHEFSDPGTAGQVRAATTEFTRLPPLGPVIFTLAGYAVLADATMPVLGDPETMNDTYLEQISAAARAHVRALDEAGIIDPARVAVGGHSYGAFMTANLLAHTREFAAGIARSGAYNRTLTPFGFQTERRSFWEAPAVYDRVSPFRHADQLAAPLLLIHGERDANSGTFPEQSERLFQAIQGNGGTARLVMLPYEDHSYAARESVLHVVAEELAWLDRWLGARKLPP